MRGTPAEERFESRQAEIEAAFEEKGLFRRFCDMLDGFSRPRRSRAYKLARLELQRLFAPLGAVLVPLLLAAVIFILTSDDARDAVRIEVDLAQVSPDLPDLEDAPEELDVPDPQTVVDAADVTVDLPEAFVAESLALNALARELPPEIRVFSAPDAVKRVSAPVTLRAMTDSRRASAIGKATAGGASCGDARTEETVLKALRWLRHVQEPDGSWRPSPVANTGLAVLAFLAHGETPGSAEFGMTVQRGLDYLMASCVTKTDKTGREVVSFKGADKNEYATLIATYALCEAYGMTRNPNAKAVALKTLQRIVDSQSPTGGWDYGLNRASTRDDLSYGGWALQALKAGKLAGLEPTGLDACIAKAVRCLKLRNFKNGGFNYTAGGRPTGLTSTGCLALQLLGGADEAETKAALETMRAWKPTFETVKGRKLAEGVPGANPQYYCYYASQCKYQAGMRVDARPADVRSWQDWNREMKALYPETMRTLPGTDMGYWPWGSDKTCKQGGDEMATCLCALQLMVYYRYLPTTQTAAARPDLRPFKNPFPEVDVDVEI